MAQKDNGEAFGHRIRKGDRDRIVAFGLGVPREKTELGTAGKSFGFSFDNPPKWGETTKV